MKIYRCPCCEQIIIQRRTTPLTDEQAARGLAIMQLRGWTVERLLAERYEDLEYMSPDMIVWLRRQLPHGDNA